MSRAGKLVALLVGIVLLAASGTGCWLGNESRVRNHNTTKVAVADGVQADLFFCDRNGHLVLEPRALTGSNLPEAAVRELIRGPTADGLLPTIPEGTMLNKVALENGVARADFSSELKSNHWGGSLGEIITVYSIVNTLAQFPEIERVQILVDGREIETLCGHLDLTAPLAPNMRLVKQ